MKYQSQKCTNNQRNLAHLTFDVYSLLIFKRSDFHIIWKYHIRKRSVSPACHTSCKFIKKRFYFVDFIAHYHIVKLHGMAMIYGQVMHKSCFLLFSEMYTLIEHYHQRYFCALFMWWYRLVLNVSYILAIFHSIFE